MVIASYIEPQDFIDSVIIRAYVDLLETVKEWNFVLQISKDIFYDPK